MKFIFSAIIMILSATMVVAQDISSYFKDLEKKDITVMSTKFSDEMEVCVNDSQEFMSKAEAITAISAFLKDINPKKASQLHHGTSKSKSSQYRIGTLKSDKGNFRVFIYLEGDKQNFEVVGVLFNPE